MINEDAEHFRQEVILGQYCVPLDDITGDILGLFWQELSPFEIASKLSIPIEQVNMVRRNHYSKFCKLAGIEEIKHSVGRKSISKDSWMPIEVLELIYTGKTIEEISDLKNLNCDTIYLYERKYYKKYCNSRDIQYKRPLWARSRKKIHPPLTK